LHEQVGCGPDNDASESAKNVVETSKIAKEILRARREKKIIF